MPPQTYPVRKNGVARIMNGFLGRLLCTSMAALCSFSTIPAQAAVARWGVNAHLITNPTYYPASSYNAMFKLMQSRGLTHIRVGVPLQNWTDSTIVTKMNTIVTSAAAYGITVEAVLFPPFDYNDRTDSGKYPAGNSTALYNQGYNRVMGFVPYFRNTITDYELDNELNLRNLVNGSPLWGKGMTSAEFNTPLMKDWSYVLRGMSDAIAAINAKYGTKLRRVVGTTGSMFGYIDYMKSQGVGVDVIGYHYYQRNGENPSASWLATGGSYNLFTKLASYKVPVHLNEVNCGEIYDSSFSYVGGNTSYENCLKGLHATLSYFSKQTTANIENIDVYEMFNEPNQASPENRFGLYKNLTTPYATSYITTLYSGGTLSALEKAVLAAKGLSTK